MAESQNQKIDQLFAKVRSIADKAKSARAQLGEPILDRILSRANKNLARFGDGNGVQQPQQPPPQEAKISCPRCGVLALQGSNFCAGCGFDFSAEARRQLRERFERERLERSSRVGVVF